MPPAVTVRIINNKGVKSMKKKILALACAVACVSVFTAVFAACSGDGGGTEVEVPEGMKEYKLEAEYTPVADLIGGAQSGSASGYDLIQESSAESVSNGYFIHNIHMTNCTITFDFTAERAGTAAIYLRLITQWGNSTTFTPENLGVVLNGTDISYSSLLVKGSSDDAPDFRDYLVTQSAAIKQGANKLEIIVRENTINTYTHSTGGPAIDCVKLVSDAGISWTPLTENLDHVGQIEV